MDNQPSEQTPPETWEMLARYLAGESTSEEAAHVRQWLAGEPSRASLLQALGESLDRLPRAAAADVDVEAALRAVKARRFQERSNTPWRTNLLRAAALAGLVLIGSAIWHTAGQRMGWKGTAAVAQVFSTKPGQTDSLQLADGTHVVLGPGSRLNVAAGYGTQGRTVQLTGEALFDVVHDSARPFSVNAGGATIRDVGTTFAVRNNPGEPVHVAVTAGTVVLHAAAQDEKHGVVLHAGDHGTLATDGTAAAQPHSVSDDDLAWTRGQLVLADASLAHVAAELRRWYGIEFRVADAALTNRHVTASFKGEPADQVLKVIGLTLGARIERNGDTAIVHSH